MLEGCGARGVAGSTIDADVRIEPESDALLREIPALKDQLGINVELASSPDFIPELPVESACVTASASKTGHDASSGGRSYCFAHAGP